MPKRLPKPEPIPSSVECSVCGLPWEGHGDEPTMADCVRLLRAALTAARFPQWSYTTTNLSPTISNVTFITPDEDDPPASAVA